jgi:hypothetical protein
MSLAHSAAPDWPAVFRNIDRAATAWTPESLRAAYVRHGCAVVRGAIDLEKIARVREVTVEAYARTRATHMHDKDIAEASGGRVSGFDLIAHPLLTRFLDLVFVGQRYRREDATSRRIGARASNEDWQAPLELHVDSFFHEFWFTVNFWVPFDACGVEAPGLQLLPIDYRSTRRYTGFSRQPIYPKREDFENSRYFPTEVLSVERIERDFGAGSLFRPAMQPGDVIIASNWIVHGSYETAAMSKGRSSIELRFIGNTPDIAVQPDGSDRYRLVAWSLANRTAGVLGVRPPRTGIPFWAERM